MSGRAWLAAVACVSGCSLDFGVLQGGSGPADGASPEASFDAGPLPEPDGAASDATGGPRDGDPSPGCPSVEERPEVTIEGDLTRSTTWSCHTRYHVVGPTYVAGGTLTIAAGTEVVVDPAAFVAILRDARIDASGTQSAPIVLTAAGAPGTREPWGGLKLLGRAPAGDPMAPPSLLRDPRLEFGGTSTDHDCGRLRYVRVELAGHETEDGGLELGGCGRATTVDYVQVHGARSHGVRVLGGDVDLRHLVVSASARGGLRWSLGWTGRGQFVVVLGSGRTSAEPRDLALVYGSGGGPGRRSSPTLINLTLISSGSIRAPAGMLFEDASDAALLNVILWGRYDAAVDLYDVETSERAASDPPSLALTRSMLFGMGADPAGYFTAPAREVPGAALATDEVTWSTSPSAANRFGVDPALPRADSPVSPLLVPPPGSPAATGAGAPPDDGFFDGAAAYAGAFEPGGSDWTEGWTAYPSR